VKERLFRKEDPFLFLEGIDLMPKSFLLHFAIHVFCYGHSNENNALRAKRLIESGQILNRDYTRLRSKNEKRTEISFYLLTAYFIVGVFVIILERSKIELPAGQMTHSLRHTFASHFMSNGGNIVVT
jgi:hypothetical protein